MYVCMYNQSSKTCVCMYVCMYVCMHACMQSIKVAKQLHVCIYAHMYVCMYVCNQSSKTTHRSYKKRRKVSAWRAHPTRTVLPPNFPPNFPPKFQHALSDARAR